MRKILFIALLGLFTIVGCKPDLSQRIIFEIEEADHQEAVLNIINARLEAFGVDYEIVPTDIGLRYELKVPKSTDVETVERLLTKKGELGFWKVYSLGEILTYFPIDSIEPYIKRAVSHDGLISVSIKDTAKVSSIINQIVEQQSIPQDMKLRWLIKPDHDDSTAISLCFLRGSGVKKGAAMDGRTIVKVKAEKSRRDSHWMIDIAMNSEGAVQWASLTKSNIGRVLAITIDNKVYSAPMVNARIEGGRSSITGNFSEEEAKEMAAVLHPEALPCAVKILDEKKSSSEKQ